MKSEGFAVGYFIWILSFFVMATGFIISAFKKKPNNSTQYAASRSHPHHTFVIKESKETAFSETRKRFGRNGRNDRSDAFRHCFWSAMLARDLGYQNALQFTNAHESGPRNPPLEKAMDLHNNSIGLTIGKIGGNNNQLSGRCMAALLNGQLKVIK